MPRLILDRERARSLGRRISRVGLERIINAEAHDPQYVSIERLVLNHEDKGLAVALIVANALVSYQLTGRGEDYWDEFASHALGYSGGILEFFESFLSRSRHNRRLIGQKLSRLRRKELARLLEDLYRNPLAYASTNGYMMLWRRLGGIMGNRGSKTVAFAVKMYYYAARVLGARDHLPFGIPIPVDTRVSLVAATSGMLCCGDWRRLWRTAYRSERNLVSKAWGLVGEEADIPPLHLDVIVWRAGGIAFKTAFQCDKLVEEAASLLSESLGITVELGRRVSCELFYVLRCKACT